MIGRLIRAAGICLLAALVCGMITGFLVRLPVTDTGMRERILRHMEASSGLTVTEAGPMTIRVLPRPALDIAGIGMTGADGALLVDGERLTGTLGLLDLLTGDPQIRSTTLESPTATIDLDRLLPLARSLVAAPPADTSAGRDALAFLHISGLTFRSGVVRLVSSDPRQDMLFTDLTATVEWPAASSSVSLAGQATWRGIGGDVTLLFDVPDRRPGAPLPTAYLRLKSAVLDLTADGTLSGTGELPAVGKLTATTRDLSAFLRAIGTPAPQLQAIHEARLSGAATLTPDMLSMDGVRFGLDGMNFDGALVFHDTTGRAGLAGTLATDNIDLAPFLSALPSLVAPDGAWNETPFDTRSVADDDIDLRISASQARVGGLELDDGSLSLQSGKGRMELSLGEARAYDGLLKGRLVATVQDDMTEVRADATLSRLDLTALAKDLGGSSKLQGTTTGHVTLEGRGRSSADVVRSLVGRGQVSIRDGQIDGPLLGAFVRAAPMTGRVTDAGLVGDGGSFDAATAGFDIAGGQLVLKDALILWPSSRAIVTGAASLPMQTLDVHALVNPLGETGGQSPAMISAFGLAGPWRDLRFKPERTGF